MNKVEEVGLAAAERAGRQAEDRLQFRTPLHRARVHIARPPAKLSALHGQAEAFFNGFISSWLRSGLHDGRGYHQPAFSQWPAGKPDDRFVSFDLPFGWNAGPARNSANWQK